MHVPILIFFAILANLLAAFSETGIERISFSTRGIECATPCFTKGQKYFWCKLVTKGWDYCSTSPLLDYKGNKCENKCGHHGKKYQWCWTKNGDWGYCSRDSEEVHVTHYGATDEKVCTSTCDNHGSFYYWCRVGVDKSDWDYCSPKKGRNSGGTKCKTPCKKQGTKYNWCNDEKDKWQYCSEVKIETSTDDCKPFNPIPTNSGYRNRCKNPQFTANGERNKIADEDCARTIFKRSLIPQKDLKRSIYSSFEQKTRLQKENFCEKLALNVLSKTPGLEESTFAAGGLDNPTVGVWYSGVNEKMIPHIIHSKILQQHRKCTITKFGDEFKKRMTLMDANSKDAMSHIVSTRLCGPSLSYNLFPSHNLRNVNEDLTWDSKWEWLSEMMEHNPCSSLDTWVILKYKEGSKRPEHLTLCYTFKDVATDKVTFGPDSETFKNL